MAELSLVAPDLAPRFERVGPFDFIAVKASPDRWRALLRASFVQGIFVVDGQGLRPVDEAPEFTLAAGFVYGNKYQGKTNELVTQLALNAGLRFCERPVRTVFDPMAGQGTTLLWAARYGLSARGIEIEPTALEGLHRHVKKQTKLHRVKHAHTSGFVGARNRQGWGKFVRYAFDSSYIQLVTGDSADSAQLLGEQRFDLLITDLPYGIHFRGKTARSGIIETVTACAPAWVARVRQGGAVVLVFNRYQTKRTALTDVFVEQGWQTAPFECPHRMSESIVRDVLVFTRAR